MANSKYEYVKSFEVEDEIFSPTLIVVRVEGHDFRRFSKVHDFARPNDETALNLMNACASSAVEEFPDIGFSYGYSDEYSFVLKKTTKFYQRRASKIQSLIASFFTSSYVTKWKKFFPHRDLKYAPSFRSRVIGCATIQVLQSYLSWRQNECHVNNQQESCLYELVKVGHSEVEAQDILKGTGKREKHDLLFERFGINYEKLPAMYRQGSCIFKSEVEDIVKYGDDGAPVKRRRRKAGIIHSKNIGCKTFWNQNPDFVKELGSFTDGFGKTELDYIRSFQAEPKLLPSTWIVIRIDGCHFHKFTEIHGFIKPNDERALDLMNACAVAVLEEFQDLVFAYGVSDEYSFVLKKDSQLYQRRASDIVTSIVSLFTAAYVMKWKIFLPNKELKYPPFFDGRAVCYPTAEILRDYLSWRQVDCHINNQYNTCFWELVKSGKDKSEAQKQLKGTQTAEKLELLKQLGITDYDSLPAMFRKGSSVFREESSTGTSQKQVVVRYCNIIEPSFWIDNPCILGEKTDIFSAVCTV